MPGFIVCEYTGAIPKQSHFQQADRIAGVVCHSGTRQSWNDTKQNVSGKRIFHFISARGITHKVTCFQRGIKPRNVNTCGFV